MNLIERLTKDSYKYVQYGLMHFIDHVNEILPFVLQKLQEDLDKAISLSYVQVDLHMEKMTEQRKDFKNLKGSLTQVTLLLVLVQSNLMRSRITNDNLIKQVSLMIEKVEPNCFRGADEFTNACLAVLENIVGNNKVLLNSSISIIKYVLPALLKKF
jgi:hypothetical protein